MLTFCSIALHQVRMIPCSELVTTPPSLPEMFLTPKYSPPNYPLTFASNWQSMNTRNSSVSHHQINFYDLKVMCVCVWGGGGGPDVCVNILCSTCVILLITSFANMYHTKLLSFNLANWNCSLKMYCCFMVDFEMISAFIIVHENQTACAVVGTILSFPFLFHLSIVQKSADFCCITCPLPYKDWMVLVNDRKQAYPFPIDWWGRFSLQLVYTT